VDTLLAAFGKVEGEKPDEASASKEGLAAGLAALREALHATAHGQSESAQAEAAAAKTARAAAATAKESEVKAKKLAENVWTEDELSWLAKATKKIPAGYANRWETVANYINTQMGPKLTTPKTKEGVLAKYTQISQALAAGSEAPKVSSAAAANTGAAGTSAASGGAASATTGSSPPAAKDEDGSEGADAKWSTEAQQQLEAALAKYPASMDKAERWAAIAKEVEGKSKKQCVERFKFLRAKLTAGK
jgi:DnaJ family protein C protein 2